MSATSGLARRAIKAVVGKAVRAIGPEDSPLSLVNWSLTSRPEVGLCQEGCSLHELTRQYGSPLHVVRPAALRRNAAAFQGASADAGGRCEVFYSYKTNPVPGVLRILHGSGVGAEVISPYELWLARKLGVPADRIVYNGPSQTRESLREALSPGIQLLNINHRSEIDAVAGVAAELGVRPRVGLRVSLGDGWSGQFGTPVADGEAVEAFRRALAEPSLDVVAVHAHRGVTIHSAEELRSFVDSVLAFVDALRGELGYSPEILDLGGSLCIPSVRGLSAGEQALNRAFGRAIVAPDLSGVLTIERYVELLTSRVRDHFARRGLPCPRIFLEPGRAMTGNTQILVSTVLNIKESSDRTFAITDAGINLAENVRGHFHQAFPVNRYGHPSARRYVWTGPICSPGDVLFSSIALPDLAIGDTLAIMDTGAYFVPFSTSFSFPRPAIVQVENGEAAPLRRRETYEDIVFADAV